MSNLIAEIDRREVNGFTIVTNALVEDLALSDMMDDTNIDQLSNDIDNGELVYFCAEVIASKNDIQLGTDYLGACCYRSYEDFIQSNDYHNDMVDTAIAEANEVIFSLTN